MNRTDNSANFLLGLFRLLDAFDQIAQAMQRRIFAKFECRLLEAASESMNCAILTVSSCAMGHNIPRESHCLFGVCVLSGSFRTTESSLANRPKVWPYIGHNFVDDYLLLIIRSSGSYYNSCNHFMVMLFRI